MNFLQILIFKTAEEQLPILNLIQYVEQVKVKCMWYYDVFLASVTEAELMC